MKDTSNTRPEAVTIERLDDGRACVSLCTNITETQDGEGAGPVYTYDRYTMETQWQSDLENRVWGALQRWVEHARAIEAARLAAEVRAERDRLLAGCDCTQIADFPTSEEARTQWAAYRQALRDVPQQEGFPWAVEWPVAPGPGGD